MKHQNDLFRLIKSMTKAEKRYFKVNASKHLHHGQHNSIRLFDAIDAQEVYDQDAIRRRFAGERFARQLAVQKNYLYTLILKTLRAYHAGASVAVRVTELLHAVEVLSDRGLYDQCPDLIEQALGLAREHEEFALELRVLELVRHIAYERNDDARRDAVVVERRGVLEKLTNLWDYEGFGIELSQQQADGGAHGAAERELLARDVLQDESRALSLRALARLHNTRMNCAMRLGDAAACQASAMRSIEILERFSEVPTTLEHHMLICHYLPMYTAHMVGDTAAIRSHLARVTDVHVRSQYARTYKRFLLHQFGLVAEMLDRNLEAARAAAVRVEALLRDRPEGIRPLMTLWMHRELAHAYLALGDAPRSLSHINRMLEFPMIAAVPDAAIQPRVHAAMLHLELGNLDNVEYAVQAARRHLTRMKAGGRGIGLFLTCLRRLASAATASDAAAETSRFLGLLERSGIAVADLRRYLIVDPEAWIASRLRHEHYGDAFRERRCTAAGAVDAP